MSEDDLRTAFKYVEEQIIAAVVYERRVIEDIVAHIQQSQILHQFYPKL